MSETIDSRIHERFELTLPSPFTYGIACGGGGHGGVEAGSTNDSRSRPDEKSVTEAAGTARTVCAKCWRR